MRVIGHMVTHNEYGRYLRQSLPWLQQICDEVVVYDDQSADQTFEFARSLGVHLQRRSPLTPAFARNESAARQEAWWVMETLAHPRSGDWILCIDADEFLIVDGDLRTRITQSLSRSLTLPVDEIFGYDCAGVPMVRRDGYWGNITACRLVRWETGGQFAPRIEGGGSVPTNLITHATPACGLRILHLGYADPADRANKYARYSQTAGHNRSHIASIKGPAHLECWPGTVPSCLTDAR